MDTGEEPRQVEAQVVQDVEVLGVAVLDVAHDLVRQAAAVAAVHVRHAEVVVAQRLCAYLAKHGHGVRVDPGVVVETLHLHAASQAGRRMLLRA